MTGWGLQEDNELVKVPTKATSPTPETLAEVAAASQRAQMQTLIEALVAHPDLAAQLYAMLRKSP